MFLNAEIRLHIKTTKYINDSYRVLSHGLARSIQIFCFIMTCSMVYYDPKCGINMSYVDRKSVV